MMPLESNYKDNEQAKSSVVECEVINGLVAAKQYEENRPHLPPSVQQEMIQVNFSPIPDGDVAKQLTEAECIQLRTSIQDNANEETNKCISNLREQMAEYHSLLDKLSSMTAKYEALQKTCQERDSRILSLEQEVDTLKNDRQQRQQYQRQQRQHQHQQQQQSFQSCAAVNNARRISFPPDQLVAGPQAFQLTPQQQCLVQQQTQQISNTYPSFFQQPSPSMTYLNCQPQAPRTFSNMNESVLQYQVPQGQFGDSHQLRRLSSSPNSQCYNVPSNVSSILDSTACQFSAGMNCNGYNQAGGVGGALPQPQTKRAISSDFLTDDMMQMSQQQHHVAKRFKSDAFSAPELFGHLPRVA